MIEDRTQPATKPELVMTRVFDAPRELVFQAWSKAEHVARWFTPRPLTTAECEVDLRSGGAFRVVMRMPDGVEHEMRATFEEVVAPERIVFAGSIPGGNRMETTVSFAEEGAKTRLTVRQVFSFESPATRGSRQGWTATLDQLAEHVARSQIGLSV